MIVHYYEGSALAHPGNPPGHEVTLDDRHKTAWRLFTGESHYPGAQRNFLFRAESLGPNRDLFMLRSTEPFPGGTPREIELKQGDRLELEWVMSPTLTTMVPGQRGKHIPAPREQWPDIVASRLAASGLAIAGPQDLESLEWTSVRHARHKKGRFTVARFRAAVTVSDPMKAASAWLDGIGRKKGYGMGMLCRVEG